MLCGMFDLHFTLLLLFPSTFSRPQAGLLTFVSLTRINGYLYSHRGTFPYAIMYCSVILVNDLEERANMPEQEQNINASPIRACITVGIFEENCYLYACPQTREAVIIDPGDEAQRILKTIQDLKLLPKYIINTHGHIDHIGAIDEISEVYPVPLAIHPADVRLYSDEFNALISGRTPPIVKRTPDILLQEGKRISFGTLTLKVLHTPGHTPGSICLISPSYCVFSGDTLFYRGIGRTDLPGGNYKQIEQSIRNKLYTLESELVVLPGHGQPTTILEEMHENPFVSTEE